MPSQARAPEEHSPRTKLVLATLDLLRRRGLSGAGINQVVDASRAPKGSVYHYFPGGKRQLVIEALREAERSVGKSFFTIFGGRACVGEKVRTLFKDHMRTKGKELAEACVSIIEQLSAVDALA